jgi:hypothetical protein
MDRYNSLSHRKAATKLGAAQWFCDIMVWSLLKVDWHFGGTYRPAWEDSWSGLSGDSQDPKKVPTNPRTIWLLQRRGPLQWGTNGASRWQGQCDCGTDTADYNQKKGPTESVECKTMLLLKKSSVSEDVCQQLWLQCSRPPRLHGLSKITSKEPLRPTVSTTGAPTHPLAKRLLGSHPGNSAHHVKNSTEFVCTLGSLRAGPYDIMVSFNVVLLFTRVTIREAMSLLSLFCHTLTAAYCHKKKHCLYKV